MKPLLLLLAAATLGLAAPSARAQNEPFRIVNRTPTLAEQAICLAFTRRHIELAKPKLVVLAGGTAVKAVLDTTEGITRLRGKWRDLTVEGHSCPAMATFHPAALLRQPINKRYVWRDMLSVAEKLDSLR